MADIELVIKVPEVDYLIFSELSEKEKANELTYYEKMIAYGTPLPKGYPLKEGEVITKADIITVLAEIQSEIEGLCTPPAYQDEDYFLIGTNKCSELIQQKIDKYKAESER